MVNNMVNQDWVLILFIIRLIPLSLAGFVSTRAKDWMGVTICALYLSVTTVNYLYQNPKLNAVFSTPLVFITAWYVIKNARKKML